MTVTYSLAPEVGKIARQLLTKHHDTALFNIRIDYLFRSEAATSNGRDVWGKARKVTGLNAFLATADQAEGPIDDDTPEVEPFFVIEIAYDIWVTLTAKQKVALVDHELSHLKVGVNDKGEIVLSLQGHDVEEFADIVSRHGLWNKSVEHLAKICGDQLSLLEPEEDDSDSVPSDEEGKPVDPEVTGEVGSPEERHLRAVRP